MFSKIVVSIIAIFSVYIIIANLIYLKKHNGTK